MSLIQLSNYLIVPKELEMNFVKEVIDQYVNTMILKNSNSGRASLTTELHIVDEMVSTLNQIIIEDEDGSGDTYEDFEKFMFDVVLVLERNKMSYQLDKDGSYHNLPVHPVW
jgi:hypothetical protein